MAGMINNAISYFFSHTLQMMNNKEGNKKMGVFLLV